MRLSAGFQERHWQRRSWLSALLMPAAWLFGAVGALRRAAYRQGVFPTTRLPVPVIVAGNLVAGGTGKTPLVLWLVAQLQARGRHPGVVSRGYGGSARTPAAVAKGADPTTFGDEPVLLAERAGCPVFVGRDRPAAAGALLAAHPGCDVIVCDDGLQHYALARDVEIAVEDARGHGNGLLLPAGPLREPGGRTVDATVVNGSARRGAYTMTLQPDGFYAVRPPAAPIAIEALRGKRLHAVAGIGHPQRFFAQLDALGLAFVPHPFPDHHAYAATDLDFADCDFVLMTEKDAVKCRTFDRSDLVALRVAAEVDAALAEFIAGKLHGLQTP